MNLWIRKDDADRRDTERRAFIADLESLLQESRNKCERLEKENTELKRQSHDDNISHAL